VIRRATAGDTAAVGAMVERFTPALLMQVEHRMGAALRRFVDPQDVVNDVWLATLRRLDGFAPVAGRAGATLMAYLSVAAMRRVRELYERYVDGKPVVAAAPGREDSQSHPAIDVATSATGAVTAVLRAERGATLRAAVAELDETDRTVVVLRGIEGQPPQLVAMLTGLSENAVAQRLRRALEKLRARLPASIFEDLGDT
jgi:RNA polymerase sigma factor (sigma-70 family)